MKSNVLPFPNALNVYDTIVHSPGEDVRMKPSPALMQAKETAARLETLSSLAAVHGGALSPGLRRFSRRQGLLSMSRRAHSRLASLPPFPCPKVLSLILSDRLPMACRAHSL